MKIAMCKGAKLLIVGGLISIFSCTSLDFLNYYETANIAVQRKVVPRVVRSADNGDTEMRIKSYSLRLSAFSQVFQVELNRQDLFSDAPTLCVMERNQNNCVERRLDTGSYFQGVIIGEGNSRVHGKVLDSQMFDGIINSKSQNEIFYVEPLSKYSSKVRSNGSHIVYRFTDIDVSRVPPNYLSRLQGVEVPPYTSSHPNRSKRWDLTENDNLRSLVEQAPLPSMHCPLHIYADHRFFQTIGHENTAATLDEVVHHVGQADAVFRSTSFDGRDVSSNIGFIIAKITLFKSAATNPMSHLGDGVDAQHYLTRFAKLDHSRFCLGVAFTTNDFSEGVLGLAWIARPDRSDAGICGTPVQFPNSSTVHFNSAIISFVNYGQIIPRAMFSITVAHELGHNFGAGHDDPDSYSCAPGGADGNYIMYHISGDGLKPNHFSFSSCSINFMYKILFNRMLMCFQSKYINFCSNSIIDEETEECDCGTESTCDELDKCCNVYDPDSSDQCKLKATSQCSAMASRCCSPDACRFTPAEDRVPCSQGSECSEISYCSGTSASCPTPVNVADGTLCSENLKVCVGGVCRNTVCVHHGFLDCYCENTDSDCLVCCKPNATSPCIPATDLGVTAGHEGRIPINGLCRDGEGICTEDGFCVALDGTLATADIYQLVHQSANRTLQLLIDYWYFAVLGIAALVFLGFMFAYLHKRNKPLQSLAYKDGRIAHVWFEARQRLEQIERELEQVDNYEPYKTFSFPVASTRLHSQFPSAPSALINRVISNCETELDAVKLILLSGYPMKKLLPDAKLPPTHSKRRKSSTRTRHK